MANRALLNINRTFLAFLLSFAIAPSFAKAQADEAPRTGADFYKCMSMNIGSENTNWSMFISKSVPEEINAQMTVDEILESMTVQKEIEKIVVDVAQQNIARFVGTSFSSIRVKKEYNFVTEFTHSVRLFTRHLKMRLSQIKRKNGAKPISFQIVFSPKVSETLLDRRNDGEVPRLSIYPTDRFVIMQQMPDSDAVPISFENRIQRTSTEGINLLASKSLACGSSNPYLVAAMIGLTISPETESSSFKAQLVVGMPMGITMPFIQENDQIRFTSVVMPKKVNDQADINKIYDISEFPMAFVNLSGTLAAPQVPLLVRFGGIGTFGQNGFERTSGEILRSQVPRLRGTPVGKIKNMLSVDFSIYNIAAMIDYAKYATNDALEIKELNLYISAGVNALAEVKFGMFNKKEIDDQFKSEINKTIKTMIEQQTKDLKEKVVNKIAEDTQIKNSEVEELLKSIFLAIKEKK